MKYLTDDIQLLDESMEDAVDELLSGSGLGVPAGASGDDGGTNGGSSDEPSSDADGERYVHQLKLIASFMCPLQPEFLSVHSTTDLDKYVL